MQIFVTGATGVIGERLVPQLIAAGHAVTAVTRSPGKGIALQQSGARAVALDLFDERAVRDAVGGHDVVINLATHMPSSSMRMMWRSAWRENDRIRRDGSRILVDAAIAAGVGRFIQESFGLIYEDAGAEWIDERSPVAPAPYNATTLDAERATARFAATGAAGVTLRFAGLYGPDAMARDLIGMVKRGWSPLPGRPEAYYSSVTQDDAASAVAAALSIPSGIYNVVDDEPLTRRALVDAIATAVGATSPKFAPAWTARLMGAVGELMSRSERISNRKLREASGWTPAFRSARLGWPAVVAELQRAAADPRVERLRDRAVA
jgi:nucleoside-diphosphate-sugar epimerase